MTYDLLIGTYSGYIDFENIGNKYEYEFLYHSTIQTDSNFGSPCLIYLILIMIQI